MIKKHKFEYFNVSEGQYASVGGSASVTPRYFCKVVGGTFQDGKSEGTYEYGTKLTVTWTKQSGYRFDHWTIEGGSNSTNNPMIISVTRALNISVVAVKQVTLQLETSEGTSNPKGAGTYDTGSNIPVDCTVADTHTFDGWYNKSALVSSEKQFYYRITENATLTSKASLKVGWPVTELDISRGGVFEKSGTNLLQDLPLHKISCGITGKYTLQVSKATIPTKGVWGLKFGYDTPSTPANLSSIGSITTNEPVDALNYIDMVFEKYGTYEFEMLLTCEGYDVPLRIFGTIDVIGD